MVPVANHDFFTAAAAAVGTLIGLLFVALSVWRETDDAPGRVETHRLRASAALTVFTNSLTVSLFALVPKNNLGETASILAIVGLVSILASALRVVRLRQERINVHARDLMFIVGGGVLFILQLLCGLALWNHPHESKVVNEIAELAILFLLFGIARSWELIGGPEVGFISEAAQILHLGLEDIAPTPTPAPADAGPADRAPPPADAAPADAVDPVAPTASHPSADPADPADPSETAAPPHPTGG